MSLENPTITLKDFKEWLSLNPDKVRPRENLPGLNAYTLYKQKQNRYVDMKELTKLMVELANDGEVK